MLVIDNISRSFGKRHVLQGVSCKLESGKIIGLIGPGGGGKSTLLKIIGGVIKPQSGTVTREEGGSAKEVSLMFQEGALFDSLNVIDNVSFPLVSGRVPSFTLPRALRNEVYEKVDTMLARVGLSKAAAKFPAQLSGGMRRRVSLARALVNKPPLVLLDDPTCGLDPVASSVIMNLIVELHREYSPTTLMVSHDLRRLFPVVDVIIALFDGKIRFMGTVDELKACSFEDLRRFVSCRYDLESISSPGPLKGHNAFH